MSAPRIERDGEHRVYVRLKGRDRADLLGSLDAMSEAGMLRRIEAFWGTATPARHGSTLDGCCVVPKPRGGVHPV